MIEGSHAAESFPLLTAKEFSCLRVTGGMPGLQTTTTATVSPSSLCGTPKAKRAEIPGQSRRTLSMATGATKDINSRSIPILQMIQWVSKEKRGDRENGERKGKGREGGLSE